MLKVRLIELVTVLSAGEPFSVLPRVQSPFHYASASPTRVDVVFQAPWKNEFDRNLSRYCRWITDVLCDLLSGLFLLFYLSFTLVFTFLLQFTLALYFSLNLLLLLHFDFKSGFFFLVGFVALLTFPFFAFLSLLILNNSTTTVELRLALVIVFFSVSFKRS